LIQLKKIREEILFLVEHDFQGRAGVSGVQSLASDVPIRLRWIKRFPVEPWSVGLPQLARQESFFDFAGQSACQAAPIVAIVVQTIPDPAMHCVMFFTCHFYFSNSSPEAVE
jgi:hypothetical protein